MMDRLLAITSAVVADAVRRKVVWIVLVFAGLLALAIPSLPSYGVGVPGSVYREVAIALMFVAGLTVGLSLSAGRIPAEIERRTVFTVLARDIARWQYLAATWLGVFAVVGIVVGIYTVVAVAIGTVVYSQPMLMLAQAGLAVWLEVGVVSALTIALSTRFGVVTNVLGALAFVFIGHSVGSLVAPGEGASPPWWLPSLDVFNVVNPVAHGSGYGPLYGLAMIGAFAAWSALLLLAGSAVFANRDL